METVCRICGDTGSFERITAREMMFGTREEFTYFMCGSCGCLQLEDIPEDMSKFYPDDYYSLRESEQPRAGRSKKVLKRLRARHMLDGGSAIGWLALRLFGPPAFPGWFKQACVRTDSSILDIGCGQGNLLRYLSCQGFEDLTGADPNIAEDRILDGNTRIYRASLEQVEGSFDLILMNHSLEHIPDQKSTFSEAEKRLARGGRLVVRIPLVSSHAWREYGTDWVQLDAPRHLFLHSERSMSVLARGTGLAVSSVEYDSTSFQFWGSEQYRQGIALTAENSYLVSPGDSIFTKEDILEFEEKAIHLNRSGSGDQACFILERRDG